MGCVQKRKKIGYHLCDIRVHKNKFHHRFPLDLFIKHRTFSLVLLLETDSVVQSWTIMLSLELSVPGEKYYNEFRDQEGQLHTNLYDDLRDFDRHQSNQESNGTQKYE